MNLQSPIDTAVFVALAGNDAARMSKLAALFERTARESVEQIERALAADDLPAARRIAHKLKSSAAYVGAEPLRSQAEQLERRTDHPSSPERRDIALAIRARFDAATVALAALADSGRALT